MHMNVNEVAGPNGMWGLLKGIEGGSRVSVRKKDCFKIWKSLAQEFMGESWALSFRRWHSIVKITLLWNMKSGTERNTKGKRKRAEHWQRSRGTKMQMKARREKWKKCCVKKVTWRCNSSRNRIGSFDCRIYMCGLWQVMRRSLLQLQFWSCSLRMVCSAHFTWSTKTRGSGHLLWPRSRCSWWGREFQSQQVSAPVG